MTETGPPAVTAAAIAVVICTYDRTDPLVRAIRSVFTALSPGDPTLEVVVIDNGPTGHAAGLLAGLQAEVPEGHGLRTVTASPPNIAVARNTAIAATDAPLIAFLDDDQIAQAGWLSALLRAAEETQADIVVGRVDPVFEGAPPPPESRLWEEYSCRVATDRPVPVAAIGPDKPPGFVFRTGNSLWRRARCFADPAPFDPRFGAVGGEDLDLGLTLAARGRRIAYAPDATVQEAVPAHRRAQPYRRLRAYAGGQCYAAIAMKHSQGSMRLRVKLALTGTAQAALWLTRLGLLGWTVSADRRADWLDRALLGWGKVTWGKLIPIYHNEQ